MSKEGSTNARLTTIESLLKKLIGFHSISPEDAGCQQWIMNYLAPLGFTCLPFDNLPVSNFFAFVGTQSPMLVFAGHTDVVPAGDIAKWQTKPFHLTKKGDFIYGRGTADMKGGLACMLDAAARFLKDYPQFEGSLGFLITSGEEGDDFMRGTPYVMAELEKQGIHPDFCIVGEPSSRTTVGDEVKIGRRGSLSAAISLQGIQGHVAYPHLAQNPIHEISPVLAELCQIQWDKGNPHFPPTSLQITQIQAGGEANNIIPGKLSLRLNFRFSTEQTPEELQEAIVHCFKHHQLTPEITWQLNGNPFLTAQGQLLESCVQVIEKVCGQRPALTPTGGTSDGRFIAPYDVEVIELGLCNATIHQVNECVAAADLVTLSSIYYGICKALLLS